MLRNALEHYRSEYGMYPQPGPDGLAAATESLSGTGNYLPGGPPLDGWGRGYIYLPEGGGVRVYSLGADGVAGTIGAPDRLDDIDPDTTNRSYRDRYRSLQREFMRAAGNGR